MELVGGIYALHTLQDYRFAVELLMGANRQCYMPAGARLGNFRRTNVCDEEDGAAAGERGANSTRRYEEEFAM